MFRAQPHRSFMKDQDGFSQQLLELRELWEARAQEWAWEEGEPEETPVSSLGKTSQLRECSQGFSGVEVKPERCEVIIFSSSESRTDEETDGKEV